MPTNDPAGWTSIFVAAIGGAALIAVAVIGRGKKRNGNGGGDNPSDGPITVTLLGKLADDSSALDRRIGRTEERVNKQEERIDALDQRVTRVESDE